MCQKPKSYCVKGAMCILSRDIAATGDIYSMLYMHNKNSRNWLFFLDRDSCESTVSGNK